MALHALTWQLYSHSHMQISSRQNIQSLNSGNVNLNVDEDEGSCFKAGSYSSICYRAILGDLGYLKQQNLQQYLSPSSPTSLPSRAPCATSSSTGSPSGRRRAFIAFLFLLLLRLLFLALFLQLLFLLLSSHTLRDSAAPSPRRFSGSSAPSASTPPSTASAPPRWRRRICFTRRNLKAWCESHRRLVRPQRKLRHLYRTLTALFLFLSLESSLPHCLAKLIFRQLKVPSALLCITLVLALLLFIFAICWR